MRVLFLSDTEDDYLAAMLWHGLANQCDLFAAENEPPPCGRIPGARGQWHRDNGRDRYDLAVVCSMLTRHRPWQWCEQFVNRCDKVAMVEGWDGATEHHTPPFRVDKVFRRELCPNTSYPLTTEHLGFAAPAEWFYDGPKDYDIFFAGQCPTHPVRWEMLRRAYSTKTRHRSILASTGFAGDYHLLMKMSRLALCPPGAADCESLRTMEAVAMGAVPVFVGHPVHVHAHWFDASMSFHCTLDGLTDTLDAALASDLVGMRKRLADHFRAYHTTAARAKQLLDACR